MNYYIKAIKNYVNFNGRATRSEYWYFVLFNIIISSVLGFAVGAMNNTTLAIAPVVYYLFILLPSLGLSARRLHDINKSGWWILISLIPLIGFIWLLVYMIKDSDVGSNQYGPNPKESEVTPTTPTTTV